MIEWLDANKEWIFSGLGVAVFLGGVALIGRGISRWRNRGLASEVEVSSDESPAVPAPTRDDLTEPTPRAIVRDISAQPPLQRLQKASNYVGLGVTWLTTLENAHESTGGMVRLMLLDRGNYPWIVCDIPPEIEPRIRIADKDTPVLVKGEILSVLGNTIKLVNASIEIDIS